MTVKITKPALNLREELASLRNQGGAYEEFKFYLDNLVTNGTFDSDTSGWTPRSGATLSVDSNRMKVHGVSTGYPYAYTSITTVIGKTYTVSCDIDMGNASTFEIQLGATGAGTDVARSGNFSTTGIKHYTFKATTTTTYVTVKSNDNGTGFYFFADDIKVYETAPNLVTTLANGGTYTYDTLTIAGVSITSAITDGSDFAGVVSNGISCDAGDTYSVNLDISLNSGSAPEVMLVSNTSGGGTLRSNVVELTNGHNSFTLTTTSSGTGYLQIRNTNGESSDFSISNLHLSEGIHALIHSTPYGYEVKDVYIDGELAREGEAYDYTVHDGYIKPTIEPTATTETCVIGVRK